MFKYENNVQAITSDKDLTSDQIEWSAQEYQTQNKSVMWYSLLYLLGFLLILISILFYYREFMKMISIVLVIISIVASLHIISRKPPKVINYYLDEDIISINQIIYSLNSFRSFSAIEQNNTEELILTPFSSTQSSLNIRLDDESKNRVLNLLSDSIPYRQANLSLIDKISNKLGI